MTWCLVISNERSSGVESGPDVPEHEEHEGFDAEYPEGDQLRTLGGLDYKMDLIHSELISMRTWNSRVTDMLHDVGFAVANPPDGSKKAVDRSLDFPDWVNQRR